MTSLPLSSNVTPEPRLVRRLIQLIWAVPFIWLLGGERLLLPVIVILLTFRSALPLSHMPRAVVPLFLFLVAYLISGTQVTLLARYITFIWDFGIYLSMFVVVLALVRQRLSFEQAERLIKHVVFFMFVANLLAFTYFITGGWTFSTPMGYLLPGGLKGTAIGAKIVTHGIGRELYFVGLDIRLASIFFSSMQYAAVVLITLPATYYFFAKASGAKRLLYIAPLISAIVACVFSQGRTAIVIGALAVISLVVLIPFARSRFFSRHTFAIFAVVAGCILAVFAFINLDVIKAGFQTYFIDARASSAERRFAVYDGTIQAFKDSPIIGFGTQMDTDDSPIPLGSHDWYLAILFKHGVLGLAPLLVFLAGVLWSTYAIAFARRQVGSGWGRPFGLMLFLTISSHCALCLTAEPAVDAIHVFIIAIYYGTIISLARGLAASSPKADASRFKGAVYGSSQ